MRCIRSYQAISVIALAAGTGALPAHAQEAAPQAQAEAEQPAPAEPANDPIVVTGSRIATGFNAPTPVQVLGTDRLEQRASANIGEALNEIPSFRSTETPASSGLAPAAGYVGGRILDLRGLGSVRTLTLVDGKRFVPSTTQATVDTNMIPSILLSRAEVVTGGASAVYGSDAVAGVVNLIPDRLLDGWKANMQGGVSEYGDGFNFQAGAATGWSLGNGLHLAVGGEYEKNNGVEACPERDWCANGLINWGRNPGVSDIPANNILGGVYPWSADYEGVTTPPSPSAYTGRLVPQLRPYDGITFNRDGTPRRYQFGSMVNSLYSVGGETDGPGENIYFDFPIVSPTERWAGAAYLTYEASPSLTFGLDLNYGHGEGDHRAVGYRNTALVIQADNPFIPRSSDPTLDIPTLLAQSGATSFTLGKGFDDIGPAPIHVENDVYRAVASVEYDIGGGWRADAYYQFGRNDFRRDLTNGVITSRILRAIDAETSPGGQIVCGVNNDGDPTNDDPACVPLNPFGYGQGPNFAAAADYVTENGFQENRTTQHVIAANITGTPIELPAGPLGIAVGGEFRSDKVNGQADEFSQQGRFFTGGGSEISGKIEVIEGYAEAEVPILAGMDFFNELSVNGAVRRTHYSRSSEFNPSSSLNVTTWKVGGVWSPIPALRFRITRSRDIRAPNVAELFGPITRAQGILTDPQLGGVQAVAPVTLGSNPNLQPETADTFTVGAVLQPTGGFFGRFRASVDYYDIQIEDAISTLGQQNIVTRCFEGDDLSCSLVTRDSDGDITNVTDTFQNVNQLIARGIDFELHYRQPIGGNNALNLAIFANHVRDLITVDAVGPTERAGQTGLRGGTPPGIPDWTIDATANLEIGEDFRLTTHLRWINKGFYNAAFIGPDAEGYSITSPNSSSTNSMPSRTYVDLLATYTWHDGETGEVQFFAGADNVFNVDPPNFPGANGSGNNVLFNPVGRLFKAGVRMNY